VDILIGVVIGDGDDHMGQVERGGIFRDRAAVRRYVLSTSHIHFVSQSPRRREVRGKSSFLSARWAVSPL
jgi:hypothetical protein